MSQRRTEQEQARIRKQKKERRKVAQALENARKEAREHIERLSPDELEEELQDCFKAWLEHTLEHNTSLIRSPLLYGNPCTLSFSTLEFTLLVFPSERSRVYRLAFPFLADFKGNIEYFAVDYNGNPIVNGLLPEESNIKPESWKRFLLEETLTSIRFSMNVSLEIALEGSDHPIFKQIKELLNRSYYDEQGNLALIWRHADTELFEASHDQLAIYQKLIELDYGSNLRLVDVIKASKDGECDWIFLESTATKAICPICGTTSTCISGTYIRTVEDLPARPKVRKKIRVKGRTFQCKTCLVHGISDTGEKSKGYFRERLEIARPDSRRTNKFDAWILMLISDGSFHNAERCLEQMGCKVGDDAIRDLLMKLQFDDNLHITAIGVDDVSLRKGQRYATVIYSLADHRLLCVLPGRDGKALREWLDRHPDVRTIARDRGTAYAKAIDTWAKDHGIENEVTQIADRFHLIKNFIDHVKDHCSTFLPFRIAIDRKTGKLLDEVPTKVATAKVAPPTDSQMVIMDYNNDPVYDENHNPIVITLQPTGPDASADGQEYESQKKRETQKEKNRIAKYEKYKSMREEYEASQRRREIVKELAKKYEVTEATVKKYCQMTADDFEACWGAERNKERKPRTREIDNYINMMYKMFLAGLNIDQVFWYVKSKGFSQADSTLVHYVVEMYKFVFPNDRTPLASDFIKMDYPENVYVVTRSNLIKYFLTVNPDTEKDAFLVKCEADILNKYPKIKALRDYFVDYHSAVMGDDPMAIELFAENCRFPEFKGFHDTLKRDMKAVKAAVQYMESSGLVEGGNNKYKTILRAHYGRLKIETLNQACVFSSWHARPHFQLGDVAWWYAA